MKCRLICKTNVLLVIAALFWSGSTRVFAQAGYDDTDYSYVDSEEQIESGVKIAPLIAGSLLHNDYYAGEVHVGLDCLFTGVLDPFYFGIGLRGDLGFPRDGFPFRYVVGGETLDSPSLVGGTFYVPLGVSFSPFSNDKISFFIEAKGGASLVTLITLGTNASSKLHFIPMGGLGIGFIIYGFEIAVFTEYDPLNSFSQGIKIAYRIPLKFGGRKYE
ncbi:MAG: hypothetical protein IIT58_10380 [Treponema sp.]|nr:hypothetical protein [Treponema sp.]